MPVQQNSITNAFLSVVQHALKNMLNGRIVSMAFAMLTICCKTSKAQLPNLVPNPGFETYTTCNITPLSQYISGFSFCPPWYSPNSDLSTFSVYFNTCSTNPNTSLPYNNSGFCYDWPHTGNGAIASFVYYVNNGYTSNLRNYAQVKLLDSLKKNHTYYVHFYVKKMSCNSVTCNNVGLLITDTAIMADTSQYKWGLIPANPQIQLPGNPIINDSGQYRKVAGKYVAHGGEQFITLGNFKPDNQTDTFLMLPGNPPGAGYFFDDISVIDSADILPLQFILLQVTTNETLVNLHWQTSNEINVSHYNIQYSLNGKDFKTIGNPIPAKGGSLNEYVVSNSPPLEGLGVVDGVANNIVYYRIQATDHDGKQTFSEIKSIKLNTDGVVSIYPNPANNEVTVTGKNIQQISISDVAGKTLISTNNKKINISSLPNGTYFISIKTKDNYEVQKLVKW